MNSEARLTRLWPVHVTHQRSRLVNLASHEDWSPKRLTTVIDYDRAHDGSDVEWAPWEKLATILPSPAVHNVSIAIRPSDIDPVSGLARTHLSGYSGRAYVDESPLLPGDILVPDDPTRPAVLVDERLSGIGFTANFEAIRPGVRLPGLEMWALLSCRAGLNARARLARTQTVGPQKVPRSAILDLFLPLFDDNLWQPIRASLHQLQLLGGVALTPRAASKWGRFDLSKISSWAPAEVLQPRPQRRGRPLGDLCKEVRRGSIRVQDTVDVPVEGWLPVATTGDLNQGRGPRRWTTPMKVGSRLGHPGDVLVGLLGEKGTAAILRADVGVDHNVALLRFADSRIRDNVVGYLNSPDGQSQLRRVATGDTIPHRSIQTLRTMLIPLSVNQEPRADNSPPTWPPTETVTDRLSSPEARRDLALQLQELLWPT